MSPTGTRAPTLIQTIEAISDLDGSGTGQFSRRRVRLNILDIASVLETGANVCQFLMDARVKIEAHGAIDLRCGSLAINLQVLAVVMGYVVEHTRLVVGVISVISKENKISAIMLASAV